MAWTLRAESTITFLGNYGTKKFGKTHAGRGAKKRARIRGASGGALIITLANSLLPYTDCTIPSWTSGIGGNWVGILPPVSGTVSVAKRAVIYAKRGNGSILHLTIPGIKSSVLEEQAEGLRVKRSDVIAIVGFWSTAVGETLIPLYGKFVDED